LLINAACFSNATLPKQQARNAGAVMRRDKKQTEAEHAKPTEGEGYRVRQNPKNAVRHADPALHCEFGPP